MLSENPIEEVLFMLLGKIKYIDWPSYDFLLSIMRVNCNEMILGAYKDQDFIEQFKPDLEIIDWVNETKRSLPSDIDELLERFFDCETYFGAGTFALIQERNLESPEEFIEALKQTSEKSILGRFLRTGFGSDINEKEDFQFEELIEKLTLDEKEMLLFITESTIFSSVQKANLLELLENPSQTKEDLLYLFEWFLENVFNKIKNDVRKSNQKYLRLLEKNIQEDGTTYLERLNIVSLFDVLETVTTLELSVSPFLGLDQASLMVNKDRYLFILGYDRVEVPFRKKDERLECIDVFDALADRERLAILKELSREPNRPVSLAKKLKISAGDLSNHFEKLKKGRLLESVYDGEHVKYTVKSENIRRLVNESLDKLLDEN